MIDSLVWHIILSSDPVLSWISITACDATLTFCLHSLFFWLDQAVDVSILHVMSGLKIKESFGGPFVKYTLLACCSYLSITIWIISV